MADIVKIPVAFKRPTEITPKQIWDDPEPTDLMAWEICPRVNNRDGCMGCSRYQKEEIDGELVDVQRGCRALAEETCRVVTAAMKVSNPSSK